MAKTIATINEIRNELSEMQKKLSNEPDNSARKGELVYYGYIIRMILDVIEKMDNPYEVGALKQIRVQTNLFNIGENKLKQGIKFFDISEEEKKTISGLFDGDENYRCLDQYSNDEEDRFNLVIARINWNK